MLTIKQGAVGFLKAASLVTKTAFPAEILRENSHDDGTNNSRQREPRNTGGNEVESGTDWGVRQIVHLCTVFCSQMYSLWRISGISEAVTSSVLSRVGYLPLSPRSLYYTRWTLLDVHMDRTEESGKSKGGRVCFMTNNKWCDLKISIICDFNKANLSPALPEFKQHARFPTCGGNILDHCYTLFKDSYKAISMPAFGKSPYS